jgi:hypothetical protein
MGPGGHVGAHFSVFGLAMLAILSTSAAAAALLGAAPRNSALVFLKPHAANDACEKFVRSQLESAGVEILQSGVRAGGEIAELKLIDQHYGSLGRSLGSRAYHLWATVPAAAALAHIISHNLEVVVPVCAQPASLWRPSRVTSPSRPPPELRLPRRTAANGKRPSLRVRDRVSNLLAQGYATACHTPVFLPLTPSSYDRH